MTKPRGPADPERRRQLEEALRRERLAREKSYRAAALRLLPHVCARCGRAFEGVRLKELTVHHKDHNFRNNPPDGSNWELLCLYCHDAEHEKYRLAGTGYGAVDSNEKETERSPIVTPFAALDRLLEEKPTAGRKPEAGEKPESGDSECPPSGSVPADGGEPGRI